MSKEASTCGSIRARSGIVKLGGRKITFMTRRLGGGGAERMTSVLANGFAGKGYNVSVLCIDELDGSYALDDRVQVYELHPSTSRLLGKVQRLIGIKRYMQRIQPDVVIALGGPVSYIQVLNGFFKCDLVLSERNWPKSYYSPAKFRRMERLYESASKVVFQTPEAQSCFSPKVQEKSTVIYNAITPNLPKRVLPYTNRIVAVGRLEPQKNYDMLLDAYAIFRKMVHERFTLEIYGTGSMEKHIRSKAMNLGFADELILHGFSSNLHNEIADSCMYVTTSNFEGMQNSLMEAMAMGIPCIATDCEGGGAKLITGNGTSGLLVSCGDVEGLARKMVCVVEDSSFAEQLSNKGIEMSKKVSPDAICSEWVRYLESK